MKNPPERRFTFRFRIIRCGHLHSRAPVRCRCESSVARNCSRPKTARQVDGDRHPAARYRAENALSTVAAPSHHPANQIACVGPAIRSDRADQWRGLASGRCALRFGAMCGDGAKTVFGFCLNDPPFRKSSPLGLDCIASLAITNRDSIVIARSGPERSEGARRSNLGTISES